MIVLVGLNHKTAPLAVRERLFAGCQGEVNLLGDLRAIDGVREILHLSTCNRVELVASVDETPVTDGRAQVFSGAIRRSDG